MLLGAGMVLLGTLAALSLLSAMYVIFFAVVGWRLKPRPLTPGTRQRTEVQRTRFVVVVPAHNESHGLLPTLATLAQTSYPAHCRRILVVADNCTDDTAEVARAAGVEVWERTAPDARGKGQALAWAFARLEAALWDEVVVIDADTLVDPAFFSALDRATAAAHARGHQAFALQGRYDFARVPGLPLPQGSERWFDAITIATKAAENAFVYRSRSALGLVTLLQGNGFAVSRATLARVPFDAGSIVEDAEYALSLARARVPVVFAEEAVVVSRMTARVADAAPQRLRWAGGIFALLGRAGLPLLRAAVTLGDWRQAEAAVMLLLTSRLVLIYLTLSALLLLPCAWHTGWFDPIATLLALSCGLQAVYLWMVLRCPSDPVPVSTILFLPLYLVFIGIAQASAALGLRRGLWHRTVR